LNVNLVVPAILPRAAEYGNSFAIFGKGLKALLIAKKSSYVISSYKNDLPF